MLRRDQDTGLFLPVRGGAGGQLFFITAPPEGGVTNQDNHKTLIVYLEETDSSPPAKYPEDSSAFRSKERRNQDVLGALFIFLIFMFQKPLQLIKDVLLF